MKRIVALCVLMITTIVSYGQNEDNLELINIYKADQGDRDGTDRSWEKWLLISKRDSSRQVRVYELLDSNKVQTALDYQNAAMIFQHGDDTISSTMTISLMRKAIELDSTINKQLYAAAIDRDLMYKNLPQIYGTQYRKWNDNPWELYDIDTTVITDEQRKEYNVGTLEEQRQRVIEMNKIPISHYLDSENSLDELLEYCKNVIENNLKSDFLINEMSLNEFGYELMDAKKLEDAYKVLDFITNVYPNSYNAYDSLGECLLALGKTKKGIKAYEKSLELNPNNKNAIRVLEQYK